MQAMLQKLCLNSSAHGVAESTIHLRHMVRDCEKLMRRSKREKLTLQSFFRDFQSPVTLKILNGICSFSVSIGSGRPAWKYDTVVFSLFVKRNAL